ncbi:MAG: alpha-galactosidase [Sinobacteraceae bacterium]|nr:alpha-galactosidase [Nevskiaceae bacterium]
MAAWTVANAAQIPSFLVQNLDTQLVVQADEQSPRVLALIQRGGRTWENRAADSLPQTIEIDGQTIALAWHCDQRASHISKDHIELVYVTAPPQRLQLLWRWRVRADHGPLEHTVSIRNDTQKPLWLPFSASLKFDWTVDPVEPLQRFWVEKGADTPSAVGTHLDALGEGDSWEGKSSTYARPLPGEAREMIPFLLVAEPAGERRGWFTAIEFSGRTHITLHREGNSLRGEAGLNPSPAPARTLLRPGARFEAPPVVLGTFSAGPDGAGNSLHRWIREVLNRPATTQPPAYPYIVSNSWGSGMAVDEQLARRMMADAAQLGLEMFHLDAGWFREVGDWQPDPAKFPHGIADLADFAHRLGLKFGLWVDWTQAATSRRPGALNVDDPRVRRWLIAPPPRGWQHTEPFKGITIDLGVPAAAAWAQTALGRIVDSYHLDMLEHDGYLVAQGSTQGTAASVADMRSGSSLPSNIRIYQDSGYLWADSPDATDVSYRATRAYYNIYERLRQQHPELLLEICNDGGRMVDLGSAAHGDYFSITDTYDPISNRRAFYDASYVLPPAMLESYVADEPTPTMARFRYVLRSGMLGWFSLMLDPARWSTEQRAEARRQFGLYKAILRPLIRDADLYHVSARPDGHRWDGIEYYSAPRGRGVLYAFRGSTPEEATHRFYLQGLTASTQYDVRFLDNPSGAGDVRSGAALMREGLAVTLAEPLSSALILLQRVH